METIELFGNVYEIVDDSYGAKDVEIACTICDLKHICNLTNPDIPCRKEDGSTNRHFEIILNF